MQSFGHREGRAALSHDEHVQGSDERDGARRHKRTGRWLTWLFCGVLGVVLMVSLALVSHFMILPFVDEGVHFAQIRQFLEGDWNQHPKLTTLTLYHATLTLVLLGLQTLGEWLHLPLAAALPDGRWPGMPSVDWARGVSLAGFVLLASLVWRLLPSAYQRLDHALPLPQARREASRQCWQWVWLPIIFPYLALVYTDPWIIALVALQLAMLILQRRVLLLILIFAGLGLRQDSIVLLGLWGGLLLFLTHQQAWQAALSDDGCGAFHSPLRRLATWWSLTQRWWWVALIPVLAFLVFLEWNGGIAMGDTSRHQAGWHTGNVGYYLSVIGMVFLPLWLADLPRQWRLVCQRPWCLVALLGMTLILATTYGVTHDYNFQLWTIRNRWLLWLRDHPAGLWVTMLLCSSVALWWLRAPLRLGNGGLLLLMLALMICSRELIETRYMLPLITVFQLLRVPERPAVERAMTLWAMAMGAMLLAGLVLTRTLP